MTKHIITRDEADILITQLADEESADMLHKFIEDQERKIDGLQTLARSTGISQMLIDAVRDGETSIPECHAPSPTDPDWICTRMAGHMGRHVFNRVDS